MTERQPAAAETRWLENPSASVRQRRLFNRLLWHAAGRGDPGDEQTVDLSGLAEFLDIRGRIEHNPVLMAKYEKDGFDSLAVKLAYEVFLEEMLLTEEDRDFFLFQTGRERGGAG